MEIVGFLSILKVFYSRVMFAMAVFTNNVFPKFPEVIVAEIIDNISVKQVAGTVPYTIWIISHDNKRYISYLWLPGVFFLQLYQNRTIECQGLNLERLNPLGFGWKPQCSGLTDAGTPCWKYDRLQNFPNKFVNRISH